MKTYEIKAFITVEAQDANEAERLAELWADQMSSSGGGYISIDDSPAYEVAG